MRVTVLGSGSSGNAILVESARARLLVDAGLSGREIERRLAAVEVEAASLDALLITHDHSDHTRGMGVLARRWGIPLYLTEPTRLASARLLDGSEQARAYSAAEPVEIGGLRVEPFVTSHDAVDPVAVAVSEVSSGEKVGIATDLGRATDGVRRALAGCDLLVLEANHDEGMLRRCHYPWSVKARIAGDHGHLSNRAAAALAAELHHGGLAAVVLAHLSENSNDPGLARDAVGKRLEKLRFRGELHLARPHEPIDPIDVTRLRRKLLPAQLSLL